MGWRSRLTYKEVVALGIARSLVVLAHYGDLDGATAMLASNHALANDPEALAAAAENGHESIVRLLLQHQPDLASRIAVVAKTHDLTDFLLRAGMDPNLRGWLGMTPLHRFAKRGDIDRAAIFLKHGADLHARDEEFCTTPLGYAALDGRLHMVEFLLQRGAKVTLPDDPVWANPIALALHRGHDEVACLLRGSVT